MKKIIVIMLALALLLTACAQQKAAETAAPEAPAETPVETPAAETPAAPEAETPAEEPVALTPAAPAVETPAVPAEAPKAATDEQLFDVKEGDTITYKTTTFVVEDLTNQGNYMTLLFDPVRFHIYAMNKPEILNGVEYTIVENNFNTKSAVKLRVRPVVLGKDEYLLEMSDSVTVGVTKLTMGSTQLDDRSYESAYFWAGTNEYWGNVGDTVDAGNLTVTVKSIFYKQNQYAILKIVPK